MKLLGLGISQVLQPKDGTDPENCSPHRMLRWIENNLSGLTWGIGPWACVEPELGGF